jgi:arabinogalactan endo-1,4-beta-galactosidase
MNLNISHFRYACSVLIILLLACKPSLDGPNPSPITPEKPVTIDKPVILDTNFIKGADISWVTEMESKGIKFYNKNGVQTECFALMKEIGMNAIRIRVWVNPTNKWNGIEDVIAKCVRAKNLGLKLLIDFHYSDNWADPGKQTKPAAWSKAAFPALKDSLKNHTLFVLTQLKNAGINPTWVQIGNEVDNGLLWPDGKASLDMQNFAQLISTGYDASKSIFPNAKVMVHVSNGYNNSLFRWIFDGLKNNGAKWDMIGMSLYPSFTNGGWQNANDLCMQNMNDMVDRYNTPVMVVEIGMPWDNANEANSFIQDLITKVKSVKGNNGLGVFYWEPESYNNWQGYTLGAFDNAGKPTIALDPFLK